MLRALRDNETRAENVSTKEVCATAPAEIRQFCESVSESTTKNIRLLKAIEQTVDWLVWLQNRAKADAKFAEKAADYFKACERLRPVDVDGTLCALFEEVEDDLQRLHQLLIAKRDVARKTPELKGEHKATVVDEYTAAISAIAELHNLMTHLRWVIGEHDADLEKPSGPNISSSSELEAYLKTL